GDDSATGRCYSPRPLDSASPRQGRSEEAPTSAGVHVLALPPRLKARRSHRFAAVESLSPHLPILHQGYGEGAAVTAPVTIMADLVQRAGGLLIAVGVILYGIAWLGRR